MSFRTTFAHLLYGSRFPESMETNRITLSTIWRARSLLSGKGSTIPSTIS